MINRIDDIGDDELRVIGRKESGTSKAFNDNNHNTPWLWFLLVVAILIGVIILLVTQKGTSDEAATELQEAMYDPIPAEPELGPVEPLGNYKDDNTHESYTEHLKMTINDIRLHVYIPHNAVPELMIGTPDMYDNSIVLTTQAADIRADNGKIVGAFVLKGKPMSWGLSKKGYCGIIDGKMTIGVADDSPLFERATETEGYFFRQYPLVDNGRLVENEPKGKSVRKALCDRNGEIMVVMTDTIESFHDFAQALVDLRVSNAIYLVGSTSYGYFRDKFGHFTPIYDKRRGGQKYENFVVWRKNI